MWLGGARTCAGAAAQQNAQETCRAALAHWARHTAGASRGLSSRVECSDHADLIEQCGGPESSTYRGCAYAAHSVTVRLTEPWTSSHAGSAAPRPWQTRRGPWAPTAGARPPRSALQGAAATKTTVEWLQPGLREHEAGFALQRPLVRHPGCAQPCHARARNATYLRDMQHRSIAAGRNEGRDAQPRSSMACRDTRVGRCHACSKLAIRARNTCGSGFASGWVAETHRQTEAHSRRSCASALAGAVAARHCFPRASPAAVAQPHWQVETRWWAAGHRRAQSSWLPKACGAVDSRRGRAGAPQRRCARGEIPLVPCAARVKLRPAAAQRMRWRP